MGVFEIAVISLLVGIAFRPRQNVTAQMREMISLLQMIEHNQRLQMGVLAEIEASASALQKDVQNELISRLPEYPPGP